MLLRILLGIVLQEPQNISIEEPVHGSRWLFMLLLHLEVKLEDPSIKIELKVVDDFQLHRVVGSQHLEAMGHINHVVFLQRSQLLFFVFGGE
jgi:hypothetical protein